MAKITLFWCFEKNIFLNRMMEFQVKFCHHSGLRPWRTGMLFSTKSKGHKSKFPISWLCRSCFYDLKVHFWWPNRRLFWCKSSLNTLYLAYRWEDFVKNVKHTQSIKSVHVGKTSKNSIWRTGWKFSTND